MKMIDIVKQLISAGYNIEYYVRKDGGILIREIDGQKYTGAKGNKIARSMVGATLSEARQTQLAWNVKNLIKGVKKPKNKIAEDLDEQLKKTQKAWRINKVKTGKITKRKLRQYIKMYGEEEAKRYLQRAEKYAQGFTYPENVEALANRVERLGLQYPDYKNAFEDIAEGMLAIKDYFPEDWIERCYSPVYDCEEYRMTPADCLRALTRITGL